MAFVTSIRQIIIVFSVEYTMIRCGVCKYYPTHHNSKQDKACHAVQDIQSRACSIHHGYMFCNFVSYNVNMIIPIKLRVQ